MSPSVLVVDDQQDILELLETALSAEGYRVVTTASVRDFWAEHARVAADVFIVDLTLPDGNGFAIIRELRRKTDAGIIILSGRGDETDHVLGLELGADDYVTKPFRVRELTARVNAVLRRVSQAEHATQSAAAAPSANSAAAPAPQVDVEFDGYRLSYGGRQLWAPDGTEVELTTSEFDLLSALTQRRGQVLNRDQIMNAIKGRDWESYDRVVDGIVSRLRRKIPVVGRKSHYIRTVHGVGYSFSA